MPLPKKKSTSSNTEPVVAEQQSSALLEQQLFHTHLRALTRDAVRAVIEEVMREELKQFVGAAWGECTPDLATSSGSIEGLHVPRDLEGNKEVLALRACAEERKDGWMDLLQDLRTRGDTEVDLIVTNGHNGLLTAVSALFTATLRQRCVVHKQRNVMNAIPKREHNTVATELSGIWKAATKEEALTQL